MERQVILHSHHTLTCTHRFRQQSTKVKRMTLIKVSSNMKFYTAEHTRRLVVTAIHIYMRCGNYFMLLCYFGLPFALVVATNTISSLSRCQRVAALARRQFTIKLQRELACDCISQCLDGATGSCRATWLAGWLFGQPIGWIVIGNNALPDWISTLDQESQQLQVATSTQVLLLAQIHSLARSALPAQFVVCRCGVVWCGLALLAGWLAVGVHAWTISLV